MTSLWHVWGRWPWPGLRPSWQSMAKQGGAWVLTRVAGSAVATLTVWIVKRALTLIFG